MSSPTNVSEAQIKAISIKEVVSNVGQSRGMGVLCNLLELGYPLFTGDEIPKWVKQDEAAKPDASEGGKVVGIYNMLISESDDDQGKAVRLLEDHEPEIVELADRLLAEGQLQNIGVIPVKGGYDVVFGMRRTIATAYNYAKYEKQSEEIQAKILDKIQTPDRVIMALTENDDRQDESPLDKAVTYQYLVKEKKMTPKEIGERTGQSDQSVRNYMKLLDPLLEKHRVKIHAGRMTIEKALKTLARLKNGGSEEEEREGKGEKKRFRLPTVKGFIKLYTQVERPKAMPEKVWELMKSDDVRKFIALSTGMKFKSFAEVEAEAQAQAEKDAQAKAKKDAKANAAKEGEEAEKNGKVTKLRITRKRAQDLLLSVGKAQARTWDDTILKQKLEGINSIVESVNDCESEEFKPLLSKLMAGKYNIEVLEKIDKK